MIGNNAVHPGQIGLRADPEKALTLFTAIQLLV
jgi:hypothetical protein